MTEQTPAETPTSKVSASQAPRVQLVQAIALPALAVVTIASAVALAVLHIIDGAATVSLIVGAGAMFVQHLSNRRSGPPPAGPLATGVMVAGAATAAGWIARLLATATVVGALAVGCGSSNPPPTLCQIARVARLPCAALAAVASSCPATPSPDAGADMDGGQ